MTFIKHQILSGICLTALMTLMAAQAHAQDLYMAKHYPKVNEKLFDSCGQICPEIDYYFVQTGQAWLDAIINKDVTAAIAMVDDNKDKAQAKKWQDFTRNATPSDSQYTQLLNTGISRLIAENKTMVAARGKDFDNGIAPVQIMAKPIYLGHKNDLELFATEFYQFTGGAHGISTTNYYVFDMRQKKQLSLVDVLLPQQKTKLEALVKAQFIQYLKTHEINPNAHFNTWPFSLTDNYSFTGQGLTFLYQPYEIGFYALGAPQLTVPYSELNGIVKQQYLK